MTNKPKAIELPLSRTKINSLKAGTFIELSGTIFTMRDRASAWLVQNKIPKGLASSLKNSVIYHCGPIIFKKKNSFEVISAGPTTSERMLSFIEPLAKRYGIRAVIGKGGFRKTKVFKDKRIVYLHAPSGCGALLAKKITKVHAVYKLKEFGMPEAIWKLEIKDFPALVSIDASGKNLHDSVYLNSEKKLKRK